jgi:hypothetical protein
MFVFMMEQRVFRKCETILGALRDPGPPARAGSAVKGFSRGSFKRMS